jgi:uncharacterized membrane protein
MTLKLVTNELFGLEAVIGWLSSGVLFVIHFLSISSTISSFSAIIGTLLAALTGFFAMLKMFESYKEQKAKRRIQEEKLKDIQEDDEDPIGV